MAIHDNEQEQWDAIKLWWKANGIFLIIAFVVSLCFAFGWQYWKVHQLQKVQRASQIFDQLIATQLAGKTETSYFFFKPMAHDLEKNYSKTPYATLAAFFEAKKAIDKNDLVLAEQKLKWAVDNTKNSSLKQIAKIRAARVFLEEKKFEQALALLQTSEKDTYLSEVNLVKGDIYFAQGKTKEARESYTTALALLKGSQTIRSYIQMRLEAL